VNRTNLKMFGAALAVACGDLIFAGPTTYDVTTDWMNNLNPNGMPGHSPGPHGCDQSVQCTVHRALYQRRKDDSVGALLARTSA
jgi:hypothetical protein